LKRGRRELSCRQVCKALSKGTKALQERPGTRCLCATLSAYLLTAAKGSLKSSLAFLPLFSAESFATREEVARKRTEKKRRRRRNPARKMVITDRPILQAFPRLCANSVIDQSGAWESARARRRATYKSNGTEKRRIKNVAWRFATRALAALRCAL